jgi:hypothetical protein
MKRIYKLAELEAMPTITAGQFDDLKFETENRRVWLSRMTVEDGEPYNNKVSVEELRGGYKSATRAQYRQGKRGRWEGPHWVVTYTYEAK